MHDNLITKPDILRAFRRDEDYVLSGMMHIFEFQTIWERESQATTNKNGIGFNAVDAGIITSLINQFKRTGSLSPKQIVLARTKMVKYATQIVQTGGLTKTHINNPFVSATEPMRKELVDAVPTEDIHIPGLKLDLYPFQKKGVSFLHTHGGCGIIGDEMGLGKTPQAIGYLALERPYPALIVVPASLKYNWNAEFEKFMIGAKVQILFGRREHINQKRPIGKHGLSFAAQAVDMDAKIFIINYDILWWWQNTIISKIRPKTIIFDEGQRLKNKKAKRTRAALNVIRKGRVSHRIILTGTPAENRPIELYNAISIIDRTIFPNFMDFGRRYCGGKHNGFGWEFKGSSNEAELYEKLSTIMIRRLKKEVLPELPDKIRSVIPVASGNKHYRLAVSEFYEWLKGTWIKIVKYEDGTEGEEECSNDTNPAGALVQMGKLKKAAVLDKMDSVFQWVDEFLEDNEKLILFAHHKDIIQMVMDRYKNIAVKITGTTPVKQRMGIVNQFQEDPGTRLFVGNIIACGEGLNLVAADSTVTIEFMDVPGKHDQAEDRVHRIGQKSDKCNAYYLVARGTIEEDSVALLDTKRKILSRILDGKEAEESDLFTILMAKYSGLRDMSKSDFMRNMLV